MRKELATCPFCDGDQYLTAHVNTGEDSRKHYWTKVACPTCNGVGKVTDDVFDRIENGKRLRIDRINRKESLSECAKKIGISVAELSAIENGRNR